jgi:hypothetical protein
VRKVPPISSKVSEWQALAGLLHFDRFEPRPAAVGLVAVLAAQRIAGGELARAAPHHLRDAVGLREMLRVS